MDFVGFPPSPRPRRSDSRAAAGLSIARKHGERLGELAAERAEVDMVDFRERGRAFVLDYLRQYGATSGEVITDAMKLAGICPPDDRAFGPVYAYLAHPGRRQIVCVEAFHFADQPGVVALFREARCVATIHPDGRIVQLAHLEVAA